MDEKHAVIRRLFSRGAMKTGSAAAFARELGITFGDLRAYLEGKQMPPEEVLLRAVATILDELPAIRSEFAPEVWQALSLPQ